VRVRSTRPPTPAVLTLDRRSGAVAVAFADAEDGVSPGQACVFYASSEAGARVLGGGFIAQAEPAEANRGMALATR
jgi:tRNA-specific 2-thiouridylase